MFQERVRLWPRFPLTPVKERTRGKPGPGEAQGSVPFALIYLMFGFECFRILKDSCLADLGEGLRGPAFGQRPLLVSAPLSFLRRALCCGQTQVDIREFGVRMDSRNQGKVKNGQNVLKG